MDCIEFSIQSLRNECTLWAKEIKKEYLPDIIIFIAKGGFLIGLAFQEIFGCPLIGVDATRKGNKVKEMLTPILSHLPKIILNMARATEVKSGIHNKHTERAVEFHASIDAIDKKKVKRVLIVDDAIDTGYSILTVYDKVVDIFTDSVVKLAALNVWDQSKLIVRCDYCKYENTILRTPMSKDSKDYVNFIRLYQKHINDY